MSTDVTQNILLNKKLPSDYYIPRHIPGGVPSAPLDHLSFCPRVSVCPHISGHVPDGPAEPPRHRVPGAPLPLVGAAGRAQALPRHTHVYRRHRTRLRGLP